MEDRTLEARESFDLISRMIQNTQRRIERHAGRPFLIWGYTTIAVTFIVWATIVVTLNPYWNWLWMSIPVIGFLLTRLFDRKPKENFAHTFVDTTISQIWVVMGFATVMVSVLGLIGLIHAILFTILLMLGIGTALTGLIIRFQPAQIGGFIGIVLAPCIQLVNNMWAPALFIVGFVAMMIIPGHILNYRASHQTEKSRV